MRPFGVFISPSQCESSLCLTTETLMLLLWVLPRPHCGGVWFMPCGLFLKSESHLASIISDKRLWTQTFFHVTLSVWNVWKREVCSECYAAMLSPGLRCKFHGIFSLVSSRPEGKRMEPSSGVGEGKALTKYQNCSGKSFLPGNCCGQVCCRDLKGWLAGWGWRPGPRGSAAKFCFSIGQGCELALRRKKDGPGWAWGRWQTWLDRGLTGRWCCCPSQVCMWVWTLSSSLVSPTLLTSRSQQATKLRGSAARSSRSSPGFEFCDHSSFLGVD